MNAVRTKWDLSIKRVNRLCIEAVSVFNVIWDTKLLLLHEMSDMWLAKALISKQAWKA